MIKNLQINNNYNNLALKILNKKFKCVLIIEKNPAPFKILNILKLTQKVKYQFTECK